jgi:hypothetical protein
VRQWLRGSGSGCVAVAVAAWQWEWQWQWQFRIPGSECATAIHQFTFFLTLTHFEKNLKFHQCNFVQFSMQLCPIFGQLRSIFGHFSDNFGVIS